MPRWRQDSKTGKLVPIDEAALRKDAGVSIHGDIEPFRSPIDGAIISDRAQLREHCKKHNVVQASEFTPEFYARKAAERAKFYNREFTTAEKFARKQEIHEIINQLERASQ